MTGHPAAAQARTTALARFVEPAVAGPGISQLVHLQLRYFPGDGEAVIRTTLTTTDHAVIEGVRSLAGEAQVEYGEVSVSYLQHPLTGAAVDTLALELQTAGDTETLGLRAAIYSTLSGSKSPAFVTEAGLRVVAPLEVQAAVSPRRVFAGERVEITVVVRNEDPSGRQLSQLHVTWPGGLVPVDGAQESVLPVQVPAGGVDSVRVRVQADVRAQGPQRIAVRADAPEVLGSPAGSLQVTVCPLPRVRLMLPQTGVFVGRPFAATCALVDSASVPVEVEAVQLVPGAAFDQIRIEDQAPPGGTPGRPIQVQATGRGVQVVLGERKTLSPGEELRFMVKAVPHRVGLQRWRILARPPGRDEFIELEGSTEIEVRRGGGIPGEGGGSRLQTAVVADLDLMEKALRSAVSERMPQLPVHPGTAISLIPARKSDENWVVVDVLTEALLEGGYVVRMANGADAPALKLRYRVVDARVICQRTGSRWRPWGREVRREALADLILELETPGGELLWTDRLEAYAADRLGTGDLERTASGSVVQRTVVATDSKIVERTMSGAILAGLAYIFFVL